MSEIKVNTDRLKAYANRIDMVNMRLDRLDKRMDKLYFQVDFLSAIGLALVDLKIGYSKRLKRASDCLKDTAMDFERVEKYLESREPMSFVASASAYIPSVYQKDVNGATPHVVLKKKYPDYCEKYKPSHKIPGLDDGFVPQGIAYDEDNDLIYISGYMDDKSGDKSSRIIVIDAKTGDMVKSVRLSDKDGNPYDKHAGGIAYSDGKIYISGKNKMHIVSKDDVMNADDNDVVSFRGGFKASHNGGKVGTEGSYVNISNNHMYTGTFVENGKEPENKLKIKCGNKTKTIDDPYCISYKMENGKPSKEPDYIIITPKQTQGMTVNSNGDYVFSTSFGRDKPSKTYTYSDPTKTKPIGTVTINGKEVKVYAANGSDYKSIEEGPPMAEGVCTAGDDVYMIHESGAREYREHGGKDPVDTIYVARNY